MKLIDKQKYLKRFELKEFPEPEVIRLKHPLLLCHGFGALASIRNPAPLYEVCMLLRTHGVLAFSPNTVPYAKIETRSAQWVKRIETLVETYNFKKINIVAHSMGGLDLRHALAHTDIARYAASLTTVATPHRGSSLAEFILGTPNLLVEKLGTVFDWFGESIFPASDSDAMGAITQLTKDYLRNTFNPENRDRNDVPLFSYSAAVGKGTDAPLNPIFRYQNHLIFEREGLNDSFVSVDSATWGEHIATVPVSHIEQILLQPSKEREPLIQNFWLELARTLAEKGF